MTATGADVVLVAVGGLIGAAGPTITTVLSNRSSRRLEAERWRREQEGQLRQERAEAYERVSVQVLENLRSVRLDFDPSIRGPGTENERALEMVRRAGLLDEAIFRARIVAGPETLAALDAIEAARQAVPDVIARGGHPDDPAWDEVRRATERARAQLLTAAVRELGARRLPPSTAG